MHNNAVDSKDPDYDKDEEDVILHDVLSQRVQLTPTGKISHAKTRVYTQRYRKAWEQMPDFKGWLTSVPHQPTRAFCTYCRKNLHAHRLSLLKHTCTMKHQRCGLMHQKEADARAAAEEDGQVSPAGVKVKNEEREPGEVERKVARGFKIDEEYPEDEDDEDDENIEYVVERLDDEETMDDDEYPQDEDEESFSVAKKLKTDDDDSANRTDALAEAMAHVHGEYLDENGESVNVELEMVVESADPSAQEIRIVSVHSERDDEAHEAHEAQEADDQQISIENYENDENSNDFSQDHDKEQDHDNTPSNDHAGTASSCKSSVLGESSDAASEIELESDQIVEMNQSPMPVRRDYLTRPSTARAKSVLPGTKNSNGSSSVPTKKKTITVTSGGKTVTLDTSSMTPYTGESRFLLKGQGPAIVVASKGNPEVKSDTQTKIAQQLQSATSTATAYSVPGTSQPTPRKHIILKSVKPLVAKKPCLSTHVLDTSKGLPVGGLQISLYKLMDGRWTFLNESTTNADGRCADLIDASKCPFTAGRYKLHFDVDKYFTLRRIETIYPFIEIIFDVKNPSENYHIPVLISPFGYTTYRGS